MFITEELRADCVQVFIVRGLAEFAPRARIRAKAVRAENGRAGGKETDRRDNKGGGEEAGATSICEGIILVHGCQ